MEPIKVKHVVSFLLFLCLARICTSSPVGKKHFVLVHGAWNWYKMTNLLTSIGHNVTALDQAAAGINPNQVQQLYSLSDYVEPLIEFVESLPLMERVILVGHSVGGAAISTAMESFPEKIFAAVFANALMLGPTLPYLTVFNKEKKNVRLDF
ncbi:hypothetical protein Pyn_39175 [Prunus yedoensis var. nudiflora]|uniref:AB hydrolase-1 domain-containing protein n=1 Tax=Prunus yedoensis var. nudiflora TaxID=2094558 RepID=A0A314ZEI6_PRUYE|nr:hypothetical protein Pyn_39175 [Prunus yedoensis var. nudiflora]